MANGADIFVEGGLDLILLNVVQQRREFYDFHFVPGHDGSRRVAASGLEVKYEQVP